MIPRDTNQPEIWNGYYVLPYDSDSSKAGDDIVTRKNSERIGLKYSVLVKYEADGSITCRPERSLPSRPNTPSSSRAASPSPLSSTRNLLLNLNLEHKEAGSPSSSTATIPTHKNKPSALQNSLLTTDKNASPQDSLLNLKTGQWVIVINEANEMEMRFGPYNHRYLAIAKNGKDFLKVLAGGGFDAQEGKLLAIDDKTGGYHPKDKHVAEKNASIQLAIKSFGINLEKFNRYSSTTPSSFTSPSPVSASFSSDDEADNFSSPSVFTDKIILDNPEENHFPIKRRI